MSGKTTYKTPTQAFFLESLSQTLEITQAFKFIIRTCIYIISFNPLKISIWSEGGCFWIYVCNVCNQETLLNACCVPSNILMKWVSNIKHFVPLHSGKVEFIISRCFFTVIIYKTNFSTIWTFNYVAKSFVEFSNEVELLLVHIKLNFKVKSTLLKPSWVWKAQRSRVRACRANPELMNQYNIMVVAPCILSIYEGRCL